LRTDTAKAITAKARAPRLNSFVLGFKEMGNILENKSFHTWEAEWLIFEAIPGEAGSA